MHGFKVIIYFKFKGQRGQTLQRELIGQRGVDTSVSISPHVLPQRELVSCIFNLLLQRAKML